MTDAMTNHSDMESLAAFVDGRLEREEREAVTKHLESCEECQSMVREAAAFEQEEMAARKPARTWWAAAAAVAMVVLSGAPFGLHRWELRSGRQKYFEAIRDLGARKFEARFSGQRAYAPFRRMRGADEQSLEEMLVKRRAVELALAAADKRSSADHRARALAETTKDPGNALATLLTAEPRDAATWNDIASLRYDLGDNPGALAAVKEALRLNPDMPEALFNRALILQRKGDRKAAVQAWVQYVAVDSTSAWADEVPSRLRALAEPQ